MRGVWKYYSDSVNGIIFVVDSSDEARLPEARDELHKILADTKQ